jgi:hypothetical protein
VSSHKLLSIIVSFLESFFLTGEGFLADHALSLGHLYASQMIKAATMILVVKISIA